MKSPFKPMRQSAPHPAPSRPGRQNLRRAAAVLGISLAVGAGPIFAAPPTPGIRNIVLVHGAFADGSSWTPVISRLQAMGYQVTAVQNPLSSLADDVAATAHVLRRQTGDVVLVGHSWGGTVITEAGNAPQVKALVYLSALAPDNGESVTDLLQRLHAPLAALTPDAEGLLWLDDPAQFHRIMAADVPIAKARQLAAIQQPIAAASFTGRISHAAWRDKPSWYLHTTRDQALQPAVQLAIAQQMGATRVAIPSSHFALQSHPEAVARLIDQAARTAARSIPDTAVEKSNQPIQENVK